MFHTFGWPFLFFALFFSLQKNSVEREKVVVQPIIYRPTQETMLNGTTIKSITQSVPSTPAPP